MHFIAKRELTCSALGCIVISRVGNERRNLERKEMNERLLSGPYHSRMYICDRDISIAYSI